MLTRSRTESGEEIDREQSHETTTGEQRHRRNAVDEIVRKEVRGVHEQLAQEELFALEDARHVVDHERTEHEIEHGEERHARGDIAVGERVPHTAEDQTCEKALREIASNRNFLQREKVECQRK